jgi:hypothetical protein
LNPWSNRHDPAHHRSYPPAWIPTRPALQQWREGEVDLSDELTGDVFAPLLDPTLFATAHQHPTMKTVAWANGADLAPEFLFDLMQAQQQRAA